jgi:predicted metalloendopeptidase
MSVVLKELKLALMERISMKDWLDNSTKQHALNKAKTINDFVAYPMQIFNNSFLNDFYAEVSKSCF